MVEESLLQVYYSSQKAVDVILRLVSTENLQYGQCNYRSGLHENIKNKFSAIHIENAEALTNKCHSLELKLYI